MRLQVGVAIERDWNSILTTSKENPFPLAPRDVIDRGEVTPKTYRAENARWAEFFRAKMLEELLGLAPGHLEILGFGLGRDLGWVSTATRMGFTIAIRDNSAVACRKARHFVRRQCGTEYRITVTRGDVLELWETEEIRDELTMAVYACQFIEHQDKLVDVYTARFGEYLRTRPDGRIYLAFPREEDNEGLEAAHIVPQRDEDLRWGLEEGLGRSAEWRVLGQHSYFGRKYTLLRITAG